MHPLTTGRHWRAAGLALAVVCATLLLAASSAGAAAIWQLQPDVNSYAAPGDTLQFNLKAGNVGNAPTSGQYRLTMHLPAGITAVSHSAPVLGWSCTGDGPGGAPGILGASNVSCVRSSAIQPLPIFSTSALNIVTTVDAGASGPLTTTFEIAGGSATQFDGSACGQAPTFDPPACSTASTTTIVTTGPREFGVRAFDGSVTGDVLGTPFTKAGGHPYELSTQIDFEVESHPTYGQLYVVEPTKNIIVDLPPGLVGNPTALAECTIAELANDPLKPPFPSAPLCTTDSQMGVAMIRAAFGGPTAAPFSLVVPVYNMVPPPGVPARFGMNVFGVIIVLDAELRSAGDYGLTAAVRNISEGLAVFSTRLVFWGYPADPIHDPLRICPGIGGGGCTSSAENKPFFRLPTSCPAPGVGLETKLRTDSWENPGDFEEASFVSHLPPGYPNAPGDWGPPQGPTDCGTLKFEPTLDADPVSTKAGSATGFTFDLSIPQEDDPLTGQGPADLKKAVVTLPEGVRVSPSAAHGLKGCSPPEIALDSTADPTCPDGSKIGSLTIDTPLLDEQLAGSIYLATPDSNPGGSLLGVYIVAKGPGLVVKLFGRVDADPDTGQLTTTFDENPQLPFSNLHLEFDGGPRAALVNPPACGTYTTHAVLTSWGGQTAVSDSSFTLTKDGVGAPCPPTGFSPDFSAGVTNPVAGGHTSFLLSLSREEDEQELSEINLDLPNGLLAEIDSVTLCPEAQAAAGTCGAESRIGSVVAGAGPGANPFFVSGSAYLGGPFKGAPFSLSIVVPVVAGPFDLGTLVVRSAMFVDRKTADVRIVTDPLPTILEGIPLQTREVRVTVDRDGFMVNPTSCTPTTVGGTIESTTGATAQVSSRFQVGGCRDLGLRPRMRLIVGGKGRTQTGRSTTLVTRLRMKAGQANLRRVGVTLPSTINARLDVVENACTQAQFDAGDCEQARAGRAVAVTPLLAEPLRGGVYFVENPDRPLPDLVVALRGQVDFDLVGRVVIPDSGRLSTRFEDVPDVPITSFTLRLQAGKRGPVGVARNLCTPSGKRARAALSFTAQNGKVVRGTQRLKVKGCGKKKPAKAKGQASGRD